MLKNTSNLSCREDGFTLIELLIVIVIIGILAAIAIPVFLSQAQAARNASVDSDTRNAASKVAQEVAVKGFPTVASEITALEAKLTKSSGNNLKLASAANGNYTVTGWNDDTEKYSVVFTSANGKFTQDKTSAEPTGTNTTTPSTPTTLKTWGFNAGEVSGWRASANGSHYNTSLAKSGSGSGMFERAQVNMESVIGSVDITDLEVGATYEISGYFEAPNSRNTETSWIEATGNTRKTFSTYPVWDAFTYSFTAKSSTVTISMARNVTEVTSQGGNFRIDDVVLKKL